MDFSPLVYSVDSSSFVCPRCGNRDPKYLGERNGVIYCRRCISFAGKEAEKLPLSPKPSPVRLHYSLSSEQRDLSLQIQRNFLAGIDTLVYAVCGAGKTELSYGVIALALRRGLQVGFALPRRDVVIELYWRIKEAFPTNKVVAVYGEHSSNLTGDIIILTTHQLYRYPSYFDLLVMDEIDAFPFKDNDLLSSLCKKSLRGHAVLMSATPSKEVLQEFKTKGHAIVELRTRFHHKPIPLPTFVLLPEPLRFLYLTKKVNEYIAKKKPCFVFVPSIALSKSIFSLLSKFARGGNYVNSKREKREEIIADFKKGKYTYLVTTSVLERGVTVKGLQVIVYKADETKIYNQSTLIQIAGRVGRKFDAPGGDVIFLATDRSKEMEGAKREIAFCNTFL
jgi:competence protein ComFA